MKKSKLSLLLVSIFMIGSVFAQYGYDYGGDCDCDGGDYGYDDGYAYDDGYGYDDGSGYDDGYGYDDDGDWMMGADAGDYDMGYGDYDMGDDLGGGFDINTDYEYDDILVTAEDGVIYLVNYSDGSIYLSEQSYVVDENGSAVGVTYGAVEIPSGQAWAYQGYFIGAELLVFNDYEEEFSWEISAAF